MAYVEEHQRTEEALKLAQEEKETLQKNVQQLNDKLTKMKSKYKRITQRYEVLEERFARSESVSDKLSTELREKISKSKQRLAEKMNKEKKVKSLVDIIKISLQQGKFELSEQKVSRHIAMRERIFRMANMLEDRFGGMVFVAPLDIPENSALGSAKRRDGQKFMSYIWSKRAIQVIQSMGMNVKAMPMLERSPMFKYVLDSRTPYFPDLKLLSLPKNHLPLTSALLIPIVVDGKTLGLVGFGNGTYTTEDADVLFEMLPQSWMSVLSEAVKESYNQYNILANTLPTSIVDRLISLSSQRADISNSIPIIADSFDSVTVMFVDIVNFTKMSTGLSAEKVVSILNYFFSMMDDLVVEHGLEKIKTIGDAYMLVGGIPKRRNDHAEAVADIALELLDLLPEFNLQQGLNLQVRIGIHTGPVVAGVIGKSRFSYDVWGDTVNKASRMESTSRPNCIQISEETAAVLKGLSVYKLSPRGNVKLHGFGEVSTFWLTPNSSTEQVKIQALSQSETRNASHGSTPKVPKNSSLVNKLPLIKAGSPPMQEAHSI